MEEKLRQTHSGMYDREADGKAVDHEHNIQVTMLKTGKGYCFGTGEDCCFEDRKRLLLEQ